MAKYLVGAVALIILLGGGYYLWEKMGADAPAPEPLPEVQEPLVSTYASTTLGVSLTYPSDFTVNENYAYAEFGQDKLIHGVSFTIPMTMATGTNLSSDSYIAVETLPRARACTGDIYVLANVTAEDVIEGGRTWSLATSTEGAAGSTYEEYVYALKDSKPCMAVRYLIHTTSIENYPMGTVSQYDRFSLLSAFDAIRRSIMLTSAPVAPAATSTSF